jgi:hypothetical protein
LVMLFTLTVKCGDLKVTARVRVKVSKPRTGPEGSRRSRLPHFKTFGT